MAYNPIENGVAEAFNKTMMTILKTLVQKSKQDLHEKLGECLWAYHTTVHPIRQ